MSQPPTMQITTIRQPRYNAAQQALDILATTGIAIGPELVEHLVAEGIPSRAAYRAVINDLDGFGWATKYLLKLHHTMRISLIRISDQGWNHAYLSSGISARQSEWDYIRNGHPCTSDIEGDRHTLGCLILAWQARKRGWQVKLLPRGRYSYSDPRHWSEPDIELKDPEGFIYPIEFETRARHKIKKWKKQHTTFAVCSFTDKNKGALMREIRKAKPNCRVIFFDLQSMLQNPDLSMHDLQIIYDRE